MSRVLAVLGVVGAVALPVATWPVAAAAQSASGGSLSCILHFDCEGAARAAAPVVAAPAEAAPAASAAAPVASAADAGDDTKPEAGHAARRRHTAERPVITVAADAAEIHHLDALKTVMPGQVVKVVAAPARAADLVVTLGVPEADAKVAGTKLFSEQVHILARAGIATVADLRGKVVSFGPKGSAGQQVARRLFAALDVKVDETPLDLANALDGAATGDVDAVVIVAPAPFEPLRALAASPLHLVALPDAASLPDGVTSATVAPGDYPGLKTEAPVKVAAVPAVLTLSPKGARMPAAKRLLEALNAHSATLSRQGFDLLRADAGTSTRVARADGR